MEARKQNDTYRNENKPPSNSAPNVPGASAWTVASRMASSAASADADAAAAATEAEAAARDEREPASIVLVMIPKCVTHQRGARGEPARRE